MSIIPRQKALLPPYNVRTICPPGKLVPHKDERYYKPIIVASLMRSGTHLLIDSILNNFSVYKRKPLYVDIDHLLDDEGQVENLIEYGGYVVKTHFPQAYPGSERSNRLSKLAKHSYIIQPNRNLDDVYRSSIAFGTTNSFAELDDHVSKFNEYWSRFNVLNVPFTQLIVAGEYRRLIHQISEYIMMEPNKRLVYPIKKSRKIKVYSVKMLTRLLGNRSPMINTTIGFAKTKN